MRDTFQEFKNRPVRDREAGKFAEPLSGIIGIVDKWHLEERRWREIRKAIIEAEEPVNSVLNWVAEDLDGYVDPLLDLAVEDRYRTAIVYYNLKRKDLNIEQRTSILQQIREYKAAHDTAKLQKPSSIPAQMKKVHVALAKVAKSNRAPKDLAALKAELDRRSTPKPQVAPEKPASTAEAQRV